MQTIKRKNIDSVFCTKSSKQGNLLSSRTSQPSFSAPSTGTSEARQFLAHKKIFFFLSFVALAAVAICGIGAARAGSLVPSANPDGTMYTLNDIYTRLTTNAAATEGDHDLLSSLSPAATMHTLKEIYNAIPTIAADTVKVGTSYLGISGTLYGDTDASKVLTTASGAGTYNAANLVAGNIKNGTAYGVSSTGTLLPNGGTAAVADLFSGKTSHLTGDWDLDTGILNIACNTSVFDAAGNKAADAYDGGGNGNNRWCITDSGNAVAGDILSGKTAWVDGLAISGTGTVYAYGDSNAAKVLGSATGAGTALASLFNGSDTANAFPGGSQANGGVDDYNNGDSPASGRYSKGWTQCDAGNNYCGTGNIGADARDDSTGLVWSMPCNGIGCTSFSDASPVTYSWDNSAANNNSNTASQLCSIAGWNLPHQKQLMQAYIDGSYGNLEASGVNRLHWSATTVSNNTANVWNTVLSNGYTDNYAKTSSYYVRCVIFSPGN